VEYISATITRRWSLDTVIARMKQHEQVEGLLPIGSLSKHALTTASDYDLIIVLRHTPSSWYVGVTYIDDGFTDLVFVAASALGSVQALTMPVPFTHELAPIIRWLQNGVIVFDRTGQIQHLRQRHTQFPYLTICTFH
jgi:hypothetical protein